MGYLVTISRLFLTYENLTFQLQPSNYSSTSLMSHRPTELQAKSCQEWNYFIADYPKFKYQGGARSRALLERPSSVSDKLRLTKTWFFKWLGGSTRSWRLYGYISLTIFSCSSFWLAMNIMSYTSHLT